MHKQNHARAAIYGLLIGDALGVPYEFHDPEDIPPLEQIEMQPPKGFARAHSSVPIGTWSDDGAQALILLESLIICQKFDPRDFADRLIRWYNDGYFAVGGVVFDIGIQTAKSIGKLMAGVEPLEAGSTEQFSQGNGSLMRVLPLAVWHSGSDAELVRDAMNQSKVTHGHPVCLVCCALYCLWARQILKGTPQPFEAATLALERIYHSTQQNELLEIVQDITRPNLERKITGSGYVLDALFSSKWALERGQDYEQVVKNAIALGHDTDTTACIAGGLAGLYYGPLGIPKRWLEQLRGRDLVEQLLAAF
jgi:ADP-ribosyl-[dinitrogen reductase] hydrolase